MMRVLVGATVLVGCYKNAPDAATPPVAQSAPVASTPAASVSRALGDPIGFLPGNSELVLSVDGDQLRTSALWTLADQKLRAAGGSSLTTFTTTCGFDPMSSIRHVTLGLRGLERDVPEGVLVLTGLPRQKLVDCFARTDISSRSTLTVDGDVYTIRKASDPSAVIFTFVDDTTLVVLVGASTNRSALDKVIASGAPLRRSPAFTQLLDQVDTSAAIWGAVHGRSSMFDITRGSQKPTAVWGSIRLEDGAALSMRLRFGDTATAQQLVNLAQTQIQGAAQMFFDRIDVSADGAEVAVEAAMSEAKLSTLLSLIGMTTQVQPPTPSATP